ncbi:MAG: FAD-dependent oxidoreductase [Bacillota bacterium]
MKKNIYYNLLITAILILSILMSAAPVLADGNFINSDVLIFGGEPEGIAAACASARAGVDTVLVMERENPGGLMTYGGLNFLDLNYDKNGNNINKGIFLEWHKMVGEEISFDPEKAEKAFWQLLNKENNITVLTDSELEEVILKDNKIVSLTINKNGFKKELNAEIIIDASQDGNLAYKAGNPYFYGQEDINVPNRVMASTQILKFKNINYYKLYNSIKNKKFSSTYINGNHAWGFSDFGKKYNPTNDKLKLRGLNIVFTENKKTAYINALLLFNVDPLDPASVENAKNAAVNEADSILKYLNKNLPGFSDAVLADFPAELYRRESRHFLSRYQLGVKDQFMQRIFRDTVTLASYPLDYQASGTQYPGFVLFNPGYYAVPLRSLLSINIDNLMIVGRSSGFSSLAASSARVLPVGMNTGEAAGIAAAEALKNNLDLIDVIYEKQILQKIRTNLDINIEKYPKTNALIDDSEVLPYLTELLSWGISIGGYNNNFKIEDKINEKTFVAMILKGMQRKETELLYEWVPGSLETLSENKNLTSQNALKLLLAAMSRPVLKINTADYFALADELEIIPAEIRDVLKENSVLKGREAVILAGHFINQFETPERLKHIRGEYFD